MVYRMITIGAMVIVLLTGQTWGAQHQAPPVVTETATLPLSKIVLYTSGVGYPAR